MATKEGLVREIPFHYLKEFIDVTGVLRRTSAYRSKEDHVQGLVRALQKEECEFLHNAYTNEMDAHTSGMEFCRKLRPDEKTVRAQFLKYLINETKSEEEAIFCEFPLETNRSDINRFNGSSYTYELKSPRDSFKRLPDQLDSYKEIFEFIYLVLPEEVSQPKNLPQNVGLITYTYPDFQFNVEQEAKQIIDQDPSLQLKQLWLDELSELADESVPSKGNSTQKKDTLINEITKEHSDNEINCYFKSSIKKRYSQDGPKEGATTV